MSITLSTGLTVACAKTYASALSFSAISNAADAACTVVGSTIVAGDYVEIRSSWGLIDQKVVRVKTGTTATSLVLEGVDTTDTTKFPAGNGAVSASVRKITTWSTLSQVKSVSASGGTQNYADVTAINDQIQRQQPTNRSAVTMTLACYDDPTLAWYADVNAADVSRSPYGLLMTFPNGSKLCANAFWGLMKVPTMNANEALMTEISLSYAAEPMRYAS